MAGYNGFCRFYDALMADADYPMRAKYVLSLFEKFGAKPKLLLDVGCGTGEFIKEFQKRGIECIGAEPSLEMLSVAREKCPEALLLNQAAEELDLYGTVDSAVCLMDTLNHITDFQSLSAALQRISLFLEPECLFIFDVNSEYKHREVLADNAFVFEQEGVLCTWRNFTEGSLTDIYLDFFEQGEKGCYKRFSEDFSERAYSDSRLKEALKKANFEILASLDDMSLEPPKPQSERIYYVVKKVK